MNITLNLDDELLENAVNKGIRELSTAEISEIAKKAISEYMKSDSVISRVVFETHREWNGEIRVNREKLREFSQRLIERSFSDDELKAYREKAISKISELPIRDIITEAITKVLIDSMFYLNNKEILINEIIGRLRGERKENG